MSIWIWIGFFALVLVMLGIDLGVTDKHPHEIKVKEALVQTAIWIAVSLLFCFGIFVFDGEGYFNGGEKALEFLTGYLIEKSLSMDNLFVFLMLFSYFGIPGKYQHEVLFWGIFGALILRSIFIFAGVSLINRFVWIIPVFGAFLVFTGIKTFLSKDNDNDDPGNNLIIKLFKKIFPVTPKMHEDKFFVREAGKLVATPIFLALLVIEASDIVFAVDSIPAVLAVSHDPFIVLTSNVFAILGLRALYFALAGVARYFVYLKYGLGVILSFVGVKMLLGSEFIMVDLLNMDEAIEIPTLWSLAVICVVLTLSMVVSVVVSKKKESAEASGK
ncbi:MAG: TerC family protein [Paludibacteraceae bacterium]|nr:TerC family protein [Paludibacteraceae bacterium]